MARGRFITLEGGEGGGKSTQARRLGDRLQARGLDVVLTREPGGSPAAERVRTALLGLPPEDGVWAAEAECLLHFAARRQHMSDVIEPALATGAWVISDRFADSTMAYQGYAGGLGRARVEALEAWTLSGFTPDLTIVLDLPVDIGMARAAARGEAADVYERRPVAFHEAVRQAFLDIASQDPARCAVVDATEPEDAVAAAVANLVDTRLRG